MSAYVDPILKLLIDIKITDNLDKLGNRDKRIDNSIINKTRIASNIVLIDLSSR